MTGKGVCFSHAMSLGCCFSLYLGVRVFAECSCFSRLVEFVMMFLSMSQASRWRTWT
jgi:hypothetical protein